MPIILINNILGLMLCLLRSKNLFVVIFLLLMLMRNGLERIIWFILLWGRFLLIFLVKILEEMIFLQIIMQIIDINTYMT